MAENTDLLEEDLIVDIEEEPSPPPAEYIEPSQFLIPPTDTEPLDPDAPLSPEEEDRYLRSLMRVNKVDIDYDELIKIPHPEEPRTLNDDDIARYLIETRFGDRFKEGDYELFTDQGYSPKYLIEQFANVRSVGPYAAFMEEAGKAAVPMSSAVMGATVGGTLGSLPGAVAGGITGFVLGNLGVQAVAPEVYLPRVRADQPAGTAGQIVGGSWPFVKIPQILGTEGYSYLTNSFISPTTRFNLGADWVGKNINSWTGGALRVAEDFSESVLRGAQQSPLAARAFEASEYRQIGSAAAAGWLADEILPADLPWRGAAMFGAELTGAIVDPVAMIARRVNRPVSSIGRFFTMRPQTRGTRTGDEINRLLLNYGSKFDQEYVAGVYALDDLNLNPLEYQQRLDEIQTKYIEDSIEALTQGSAVSNELETGYNAAALSIEEQTAGIRSGLPFFYILEGRLSPLSQRTAQKAVQQDPVVTDLQANARNRMIEMIQNLNNDGSPEALAMAAQLRQERAEIEIQNYMSEALQRYQTTVRRAIENGETLDTGAYLHKLFFGEDTNSLLSAVKAQSKHLMNQIPRRGVVDLNPLVKAYNDLNEFYKVAGQTPRISTGKDLVSIDVALRQFDDVLKRLDDDIPALPVELTDAQKRTVELKELDLKSKVDDIAAERKKKRWTGRGKRNNYRDNQRLRRLELERDGLKDDIEKIKNPVEEISTVGFTGEEITVENGDLITFIEVLDSRLQDARRTGNVPLINILNQLRKGSLESMGTSTMMEAQVFYDFNTASARVFSNNFLGEMRTDIAPELIGTSFFEGAGDKVVARIAQMEAALQFLRDQDIDMPPVNLTEMGAAGRQAITSSPWTGGGKGVGTVSDIQETMLRGMMDDPTYFKDVQQIDALGNPMFGPDDEPILMKEATGALDRFVQRNRNMLETTFPEALEILEDVQKTRAYWKIASNRSNLNNLREEAKDAFIEAFADYGTNPTAGIQAHIGTPESRPNIGNVGAKVRQIVQIAAREGPEVKEELYRTLIDDALTYARVGKNEAGDSVFSPYEFRRYFEEPLSRGEPSLSELLTRNDIIGDEVRYLQRSMNNLWEQIDLIEKSDPTRIRQIPGGLDLQREAAKLTEGNLASGLEGMFVGIGGSAIGSSIRNMFGQLPILSGGSGGLIAASEGAKFLRQVLLESPQLGLQDLFISLSQDPQLMAAVMRTALDKKGLPVPPDPRSIRRMHAWIAGAGLLDPAEMTVNEFQRLWGLEPSVLHPERDSPGAAAGLRRRQLRQQQPPEEVVVEETEEVDFSPTVGFTPPPMPPLTMPQGQASTGQAPPSTGQDAYAAAFPFDSVSEVIRSRQGIGSLG